VRGLRWPFAIAVGVTMRFRSGHKLTFTCEKISINVDGYAKIVGYNWTHANDAPLYLDPGAIESVVTDRVIRWRGWRAPPAQAEPPIVDVEADAVVGQPVNLEGSDGGPLPEKVKLH
jgi:hypothetical protein